MGIAAGDVRVVVLNVAAKYVTNPWSHAAAWEAGRCPTATTTPLWIAFIRRLNGG
jgi:hypothetical protein